MDPTIEMEQDLMEFGGDLYPAQTFDVYHFDDLKLSEAHDGLLNFSCPPKPHHGQDEIQPDLDSPVLGLAWMDESTEIQQYCELLDILNEPVDSPLEMGALPDFLDENFYPASPAGVKSKYSALLHSMLKESMEVTAMLTPVPLSITDNSLLELPAVKVEPSTSPAPSSSPELQVKPEIDFSAEASSFEPIEIDVNVLPPLSPEDIESILSSTASSPASEASPSSPSFDTSSTVDTSSLCSEENSTLQSSELYKIVANTQPLSKLRSTPYSRPESTKSKGTKSNKGRKRTASIGPDPTDLELEFMSKKDRKKLQNKNAAIRYRMKKKEENDLQKAEVDDLETTNQELHEKVADLTRQIKYMKDLISEVQKARGLPSH